jgi:orotate phosphoribosyltransferase
MGGALLAHTMAGLLDSRRSLTHPPCLFAPFNYDPAGGLTLRAFYARELAGRRVLLADDVRNTGDTFGRCAELVRKAGGSVLATVEIYDRLEVIAATGVQNFASPNTKPRRTSARRCARSAPRKSPSRSFERDVT